VFEGAIGNDPDGFICRPTDENHTLRPCILAREACVFAFEVLEADICLERFDVFAHQARDRLSVFGPDGFGDADLDDLHHLVVDCLPVHYLLRTTGSIRLASLFFTFPTRVLTGQQAISSAG
jgi:hypothetical protein